jgi:hypothetical protein
MGWDNNRAVSEVLGAILLFGIIIVALGGYQAFIVPQQNAEIESNHDAQVSDEFAEIQPAISNAVGSSRARTTSVTLGTRYPVRAAALNPPTVSGQLGTGASGDLRVNHDSRIDACALTDDRPNTTSIRYNANYNELENTGAMVYENGVTYRETDGGILQRTDQQLVDGSTIRLYPLVAEQFSTGSSSSEQLRFIPGETGVRTVDVGKDEKLDITFPSRLDKDGWKKILGDADNFDSVDDSAPDDTVTVTLSPSEETTYTVRCTPVGIESAPEQGVVPRDDVSDDSTSGEINPAGEGSVVFDGAVMDGDNGVAITLKNLDSEERTIEQVRIPFYSSDGQGGAGGTPGQQADVTGDDSPDIEVGDAYEPRPSVTISPDATGGLTISFFCDDDSDFEVGGGDFFAMNVLFENGESSSYFINSPTDSPANNPCS